MNTSSKTKHVVGVALAVVIAMGLPLTGFASDMNETKKLEDKAVLSASATVMDINHETREITLRSEDGRYLSFTVDKKVEGLEHIRAGDTVKADYYASIALELREPTKEEVADPLQVETQTKKMGDAAMGAGRVIKAVCEVVSVDNAAKAITFKGPLGRLFAVNASSERDLSNVKVGKALVVTYTQGLAVGLTRID